MNYADYIIGYESDKVALIDDYTSITYNQLGSYVRKFAHKLLRSEIQPGDRIVLSMQDRIEWAVAYFGCLYIGAVPVIVSPFIKPAKFKSAVLGTKARAAIHDNPDLDEICKKKFSVSEILIDQGYEQVDAYDFDPDEISLIATTSGTTGKQKFVVHRHMNLQNYLELLRGPLDIDQDSVIFCSPKLSFVYGLNLNLTVALGQRSTAVLTSKKLVSRHICHLIEKNKVTHFFCTPGIASLMVSRADNSIDLLTVKYCYCMSEPYPNSIAEKFLDIFNKQLINGYGLSETLSISVLQKIDESVGTDSHIIGKPLSGVNIKIIDEQGDVCGKNQPGELYINHPCMATFYWNNWSQTKQNFQGDWVKTNDLVYENDDGNLVYMCRKDDLVKINGILISIIEVEQAIINHPMVQDCVVTIEKNSVGLTKLGAQIIPKDDDVDIPGIRRHLATILESCKVPKYIELVDEIPILIVKEIARTVTDKKIRFI